MALSHGGGWKNHFILVYYRAKIRNLDVCALLWSQLKRIDATELWITFSRTNELFLEVVHRA